ncbi:protein-methionine-sulfoxide reductase catalytic subunit MsrP [Litoreibacter janthinus]|uniref:Protein-methionine-sulfoxide reductase catalytic subunit MsrP n=1 Tax=Litoreibacter janthinus TaxID=670154 RepID=A0A1I6G4K4_9RHOB|nr:protein-methionine-sulfoxide reductase catalytic subunit MsrP [Litoreibacter janthinus]SFR37143.1 sulfoxide reductase catalytic subunit YedY [Litoreibacter janthinus]
MANRFKSDLTWNDVTPENVFLNRRSFMTGASALAAMGIAGPSLASQYSTNEDPNAWEEITQYNNFYEFGTDKSDPAEYAGALTTDPWEVEIDGLVEKPGKYSFKDIMAAMTVEERIYRFRCVEAWSMVIPWNGFELADLLNMAGVQDGAKYVSFETLLRPEEMWGQKRRFIPWPYREGLRLDEAMHPLTIMATGIYGKPIPNQNGAPLRLVVPWKYGFKSIKSVVKITLTENEPETSWNTINASEYGFYSNVNPQVDHPRWSQASERRVGGGLLAKRIPTPMFNGYEDQVAGLYAGMDLAKNF